MITDFQCNTIYFSALLKDLAPLTYANLISALDRYGIEHRLIPNTNDMWCRSYCRGIGVSFMVMQMG